MPPTSWRGTASRFAWRTRSSGGSSATASNAASASRTYRRRWAAAHPIFARQKPPLTALESVAARDVPGGTAPKRVAGAREGAVAEIGAQRQWLTTESKRVAAVMSRNSEGPV